MTPLRINDSGNCRITAGSVIVFAIGFLVVLVGGASGEYDSSGTSNFAGHEIDGSANALCSGSSCGERGSGVSGAMWFGPRLGKRRPSVERHEAYDDNQIDTITDFFQSAPWTLVSLRGSNPLNMSPPRTGRDAGYNPLDIPPPRPGRETGEEFLEKLLEAENLRSNRLLENENMIEPRQLSVPAPTAVGPRLGRQTRLIPPLRLGRRLRALLQKL